MADDKSLEMVSVGNVKEDSLEDQPERKSGRRLEHKAVLEVRNTSLERKALIGGS
jgi:hypothetical protein